MKNVEYRSFCQGLANQKGLGWIKGIAVFGLTVACLVSPIGMTKGQAADAVVNQLEYLQWLVNLTGSASQLPASPTAADYVAWARSLNIEPDGGWQPGAAMSQASYAQTLAQLYGVNVNNPNANNWVRELEKMGIIVPGQITRLSLVDSIDNARFSATQHQKSKVHGNNGVGNGEDPQPPGNPPINDGPGTGPGHPGNKGGKPGNGNGKGNGNANGNP